MKRILLVVASVCAVVAAASPSTAYVRPGNTAVVSLSSAEKPGTEPPLGLVPGNCANNCLTDISADARYVAFETFVDGLVPGDQDGSGDVFVRDRRKGTTERVSVSNLGAPPVGVCATVSLTPLKRGSYAPSISANGRFVVFDSCATNLVVGDVNAAQDVFVRDLLKDTTTLVSRSTAGEPAVCVGVNAECSRLDSPQSISADGRYIAYSSSASNLVPNDRNGISDVFVFDRVKGRTERVSVASGGKEADGTRDDIPLPSSATGSLVPAISDNGRFVVFLSAVGDLVENDPDTSAADYFDVFVHDRKTHRTEQIDIDPSGREELSTPADEEAVHLRRVAISPDGRYVAFASRWAGYVPNDLNDAYDIFIRDRVSGRIERVSVDSAGREADGFSGGYMSFSRDNRFLTFASGAKLVDADREGNGCGSHSAPRDVLTVCQRDTDVYIHDLVTGATDLVSRDLDGDNHCRFTGSRCGWTWSGALDASGRYTSFTSGTDDLAANDRSKHTFAQDTLVRDRGPVLGVMPFGATGTSLAVAQDSDREVALLPAADITGARAVYRPDRGDVFVRIDVRRLAPLPLVDPLLGYEARLRVRGQRYAVRMRPLALGQLAPAFELLRCAATCEVIGQVEGAYGTVGDAVTAAVPARLLGVRSSADIEQLTVRTRLGATASDALSLL